MCREILKANGYCGLRLRLLLIHKFLKIKLKLECLIVGSVIVRKAAVVLSEYEFFLRFLLDSSTSFR